jgi:hypothetical protein
LNAEDFSGAEELFVACAVHAAKATATLATEQYVNGARWA